MGKLRNKKAVLAVLILVVLVATLCALVGTSFAGWWTIGTLYYIGSVNECKYDIIASATLAVDHVYTSDGFKVFMQAVSCKRNIFTTFNYRINYELYKEGANEGKAIAGKKINFTIRKANDIEEAVNNPIIFESSSLWGEGKYTVKWSGDIKSNVTQPIGGSYDFRIAYRL